MSNIYDENDVFGDTMVDVKKNTAESRGLRLHMLRKLCNLSITDFASKYNFGDSTIRQWERARVSGLTEKGARKVISAVEQEGINCTLSWLLHGVGDPPRYINYEKNLSGSEALQFEPNPSLNKHDLEIDYFHKINKDAITMTITDDAMLPNYHYHDTIGGIVFVDTNYKFLFEKNCIIKLQNGKLICRRLYPGSQSGAYNLIATNPKTTIQPASLYDKKIVFASPIITAWKNLILSD